MPQCQLNPLPERVGASMARIFLSESAAKSRIGRRVRLALGASTDRLRTHKSFICSGLSEISGFAEKPGNKFAKGKGWNKEEALMLDFTRQRIAALPRVPAHALLSAGTVASFGWMLFQDKIHPLAIYLLQVYLTF